MPQGCLQLACCITYLVVAVPLILLYVLCLALTLGYGKEQCARAFLDPLEKLQRCCRGARE